MVSQGISGGGPFVAWDRCGGSYGAARSRAAFKSAAPVAAYFFAYFFTYFLGLKSSEAEFMQ